ncbi:MAG TPA: aminotransferase class V-fold PLP-dependent enzyme [Nitrospiraceae bacterium]|nr:aminotransferase class V-fold PLP-dependent enzyme [Nitrospiraceae bacterium]
MNRRQFLIRTGAAVGASLFAAVAEPRRILADARPQRQYERWEDVRAQFALSPDLIHMAGFFLASHPTPVREAIERHRRGFDADPIGYWLEHEETQEAAVLKAAADYLGAAPADIALTDSTTMGLGLLYGGLAIKEGQEILTTVHDHYSTDMSLRLRAERTGAKVRHIALYRDILAVSRDELVESITAQLRPETRIVAVTWVHSSTGLKLPIRRIADQVAQANRQRDPEHRVLLCVDGVHALGVEDFRMEEVGCDFLVAGTHKWMFGPRGTGLVWGHPQAWPFTNAIIPTFNTEAYEIWTKDARPHPIPQSVYMTPGGFHSFEHRWALDEAFFFHQAIGKARVTARIHALNDQLKDGLAGMKHVRLYTPRSREMSAGIVCFDIEGMKPGEVIDGLRQRGIMGSVTPYANHLARLAPSLLTSPEDVERTLAAVRQLAGA